MLNYIYQWIENIAFYLVVIVAVIQMTPGKNYKKYIQFFAGLILILMMAGPILKIFNMEGYQHTEYQKKLEEIEEATKSMEVTLGTQTN